MIMLSTVYIECVKGIKIPLIAYLIERFLNTFLVQFYGDNVAYNKLPSWPTLAAISNCHGSYITVS